MRQRVRNEPKGRRRTIPEWTEVVTMRAMIAIVALGVFFAAAAVQPALAQDEIKLGAFMPVSGISADVGAQIKAGIEVAVERVGTVQVGGKAARVRVIWYDTEGKGDVGLNVVTRALTVDRIHAGLGFLSSDGFIRVMDEFQKAGVPVVACFATARMNVVQIGQQRMTDVFQLSPTANDLARSLAAAVAAHANPKKIAMLNENTDAGRDFSRIVRE